MKKFYRVVAGIFISMLAANSVATEHIPFLEGTKRDDKVDWDGFLTGTWSLEETLKLSHVLAANPNIIFEENPNLEKVNIDINGVPLSESSKSDLELTKGAEPIHNFDSEQNINASYTITQVTSLENGEEEVVEIADTVISCETHELKEKKYHDGEIESENNILVTEVFVGDEQVAEIVRINGMFSSQADVRHNLTEYKAHMDAADSCRNELGIRMN